MSFVTHALIGNLAGGQIIVIDKNGNVRVVNEGEQLLPGEVVISGDASLVESAPNSEVSVNLVQDSGDLTDITGEIDAIFAALEEGVDPTQLGDEFATAAGGTSGSSLTPTGTIERDGVEALASTNFDTAGMESIGLSTTQSLALLNPQFSPIFVDINNDPLGESTTVVTDEDTPISGTLTATDQNTQDTLTYSQSTAPTNGTAVVNPDGTWTYTPNENYNGADSFTVIVDDGNGGTDTLVVNIDVTPVNDAPVAIPENVALDEDSSVTGTITATDVDLPPGSSLVFTTSEIVEGLTLNPDGTYVFDASSYDQLAEGEELIITVPVTVTDDLGASDSTTVTITINGTDDVPSLTADTGSVTEDTVNTAGDLETTGQLAAGTGGDAGEDKFKAETGLTGTGGYGTLDVDADGNWTYTADNEQAAIQGLKAGETLTDVITVTNADGVTTTTVTITINGTDDVPSLTADTGSVTEDTVNTAGDLETTGQLAAGTGGDAGEDKFKAETGLTGTGGYGTLDVDADGNWTYTADNEQAAIQGLKAGETLTDVITVTNADGVTTTTVTITINGTDETPVANDDTCTTHNGLTGSYYGYNQYGGSGLGNIDSIQDALAVIQSRDSADVTFLATNLDYALDSGNGSVASDSQLVDFLGHDSSSIVGSVPADATDGIFHMSGAIYLESGEFALKVRADDGYMIKIDGFIVAQYDGNQSPTTREHDVFTVSESGFHTVEIVYWDQGGNAAFNVDIAQFGQDGSQLGDFSPLLDAPTISSDLCTVENQVISISADSLLANDSDADGDPLSIVRVFDAVGGAVSISDDGSIQFVPDPGFSGDATFSYEISDGNGGTDEAVVSIHVAPLSSGLTVSADLSQSTEDIYNYSERQYELNIDVDLVDNDGSEVITEVTLYGVPDDAELTVGDKQPDGSWVIPSSEVDSDGKLTLKFETSVTNLPNIKVVAGAQEMVDGEPSDLPKYATAETGIISLPSENSNGDNTVVGTRGDDVILGDSGGYVVTVEPGKNYNIALIVDTSGSMGDEMGNSGKSRLQIVEEALTNLIVSLKDHDGVVNVKLIAFDTNIEFNFEAQDITHNPSQYEALIDRIDDELKAGGWTDYSKAFDVADSWFSSATNDNAENLAFFLTDGKPTVGGDDDVALLLALEKYQSLSSKAQVQAIGIGNDISTDVLKFFDNTSSGDLEVVPGLTTNIEIFDFSSSLSGQKSGSEGAVWIENGELIVWDRDNGNDSNDAVWQSNMFTIGQESSIGFDLSFDDGEYSWLVYDHLGNLVDSGKGSDSSGYTVNRSVESKLLAAGVYSMQVRFDANRGETGRVRINDISLLIPVLAIAGEVENVTSAQQLEAALQGGSISYEIHQMGDDVVSGGAGADILFGDSINTDSLPWGVNGNPVKPDDLAEGAGLDALYQFLSLKNGYDATDADVYDYIKSNHSLFDVAGDTRGGNDTVIGGEGDDILYGQGGDDILLGEEGNDILVGGTGDDTLIGGLGDDILIGGLGDDTLTGGDGADTFKWVDGDLDGSVDVIKDFNKDEGDKIDLSELFEGDDRSVDDIISQYVKVEDTDANDNHAEIVVTKGDDRVTIELEGWNSIDLTDQLKDILIIKD